MNFAKITVVCAVSLLVLLAGFEAFLRHEGFLSSVPANYPCVTGDPELNHLFRENCVALAKASDLKTEKDVTYKTNAMGLRGAMPMPGKKYVVFIGDSYTEGFGLEENEALGARVQQEWDRKATGDLQIVNGGTLGFSTVVYPLYYAKKIASLKPHYVLLNLDYSDLYDDSYYLQIAEYGDDGRPRSFSPKDTFPQWLLPYVYSNRSAVLRFIHQEWNQLNLFRLEIQNRPMMDAFAKGTGLQKEWLEKAEMQKCEKPLAAILRSIRELKDKVEANGGRLGIHMYPPGNAVKDYPEQKQSISFVRAWIQKKRTDFSWYCPANDHFIEFMQMFAAAERLDFFESAKAIKENPEKQNFYFEKDAHWNAKGVSFVAERLAPQLRKAVERKR